MVLIKVWLRRWWPSGRIRLWPGLLAVLHASRRLAAPWPATAGPVTEDISLFAALEPVNENSIATLNKDNNDDNNIDDELALTMRKAWRSMRRSAGFSSCDARKKMRNSSRSFSKLESSTDASPCPNHFNYQFIITWLSSSKTRTGHFSQWHKLQSNTKSQRLSA